MVYATDDDRQRRGGSQSSDFYGRIQELDLSAAGQVIIREDVPVFRRMSALKSLIVSNSSLREIHPMWFSGMKNNQIEFVDASLNRIQNLHLQQHSLPLLQTLNVSKNSIHDVSLKDFESLESLVLNSNQLRNLDFLQQFKNLKNLHVDDNDLVMIRAQDFQNHLELKHINVAGNFISQIESNTFDRLTDLKYLNISHNSLEGLEFFTILSQLTSLEVLDLSSNKINKVPSLKLFKMNNLKTLNVSNNFITEIPDKSLSGLFSLRELRLQNNEIQAIHPNAFNQLFDLVYLDVSKNKLQYLDPNLFTIPSVNLKRIFMKDNQLSSLAETLFANARKLVQLDLSGNQLKELPESIFSELINLRVIQLDNNKLESFSLRQLEKARQLRVIFLHYNKLSHINDFNRHQLGLLRKTTILTIDNNPWQCACMDEMIALLSKARINYSYELGYFENATRKIMCVVTEECYHNLIGRHENLIRELFFGKF